MSELTKKVAIVTGSSHGIGAGIAKALAAAGASVVVNYNSSKERGEAVVAAITKVGGKAVLVGGDVSKKDNAEALVNAAIKHFKRLDIVVNNAGIAEFVPLEAVTEEHYRRIYDTNVLGPLLVTQAALKHLGEGAVIINIGSIATEFAPPGSSVYTGTKGAIDGFTSVLANELGPRKIRVNSLKPGMIATETSVAGGVPESDFGKAVIAKTPLGRIGKVEEIGNVAVFLASDNSRWITGTHLNVAGGFK